MITDNKLGYYPDRLISLRQKPITAEIFLTEYCNNKCSYCRYSNETGNRMEFGDFKRYVLALIQMGVQGLNLTGGGEPTVHPQFKEITQWLDSISMPYGVNTNFNIYHGINPVWLKVSLDSATPEEYKKIRGVDNLEKVRHNIQQFKLEKPKVKLGIQCLVITAQQATDFYESHRDLDVDYIVFRPMESTKSFYERPEYLDIMGTLQEIKDKDARVQLNYKWGMMNKRFNKCLANWSVITVNVDGNVPYCCQKPGEIVGHILDPDIIIKKAEYKTDMAKCEVPCRLSGANEYLESSADWINELKNKDIQFV